MTTFLQILIMSWEREKDEVNRKSSKRGRFFIQGAQCHLSGFLGSGGREADRDIALCRAKSTRLGLCESSVIASRASFNEVYIANRILNRDLHLEDDVISNGVNEVINM